MRRPKKIVLVASVLVGGSLLAWQFRRPPASTGSGADARPSGATGDLSAHAVFAGHIDSAAPPATRQSASDPAPQTFAAAPRASVAVDSSSEQPQHHDPSTTLAAPELPSSFTGGSPRDNSAQAAKLPAAPGPAIHDMQFPSAAVGAEPERTHTISDGDTLPRLAEKYLGSAARAAELFAYNRDVLSDPELLPIGAELRIPSSATPPPVAAPSSAAADASPTAARPISQAVEPAAIPGGPPGGSIAPAAAPSGGAPGLVPVLSTSMPMAPTEPPQLIPLPPTRLAAPPRDHSYVVQPGDSLWSIAAKFYGDGRRADLLYQANRDRLWNPNDLRSGMTLVVP